jgi:purine-nucleoside phosphorylase
VTPLPIPTPHIAAPAGAFADTVLLPGDPLRARHIAQTFLSDPVEVTAVRGMLGYTGHYRGQRISVMGSGMGIPSLSIYASELVRAYGVKRLLRVGTCGAVHTGVALGDLVLALGACTDSGANRARYGGQDFAATASWPLLDAIARTAHASGLGLRIGNVHSTDLFYHPDAGQVAMLERMGVLGIEMEAAGLYGVAAECGAEAACLLTVSDHLLRGEHMSSEERQLGLDRMIRLALDAVSC